jgi:hypothetical protein
MIPKAIQARLKLKVSKNDWCFTKDGVLTNRRRLGKCLIGPSLFGVWKLGHGYGSTGEWTMMDLSVGHKVNWSVQKKRINEPLKL